MGCCGPTKARSRSTASSTPPDPKEAIAAGIGMVHQHFMLVEVFTVAENLILGREDSTAGLLNMGDARRTVQRLRNATGWT